MVVVVAMMGVVVLVVLVALVVLAEKTFLCSMSFRFRICRCRRSLSGPARHQAAAVR
jgi:hypothetical protein